LARCSCPMALGFARRRIGKAKSDCAVNRQPDYSHLIVEAAKDEKNHEYSATLPLSGLERSARESTQLLLTLDRTPDFKIVWRRIHDRKRGIRSFHTGSSNEQDAYRAYRSLR
jgi:hypothetical protein